MLRDESQAGGNVPRNSDCGKPLKVRGLRSESVWHQRFALRLAQRLLLSKASNDGADRRKRKEAATPARKFAEGKGVT
jgi:hypothetical protein